MATCAATGDAAKSSAEINASFFMYAKRNPMVAFVPCLDEFCTTSHIDAV